MRPSPLVAALLLSAAALAPAQAFDITQMSDAERAQFRAEIRAYLLDNPEILIEVSQALEARQQAQQADADAGLIAANRDALFRDDHSFVGGNPEGSLTLVEFIDYRCGYCRKAHDEVAELVRSDGDIRYVVKEFPILGDESVLASQFAIATLRIAGPEAYAKVNRAFYETFRGAVTRDTLTAFADGLGLDGAAIVAGMDAPEVTRVIEENHALAQKLQISGTPTFVLGDTMLRGYLPLDTMREIVAEVRG
ncbi:MAG: DsbA family protein [Rhodobacteraceae bacterium]|nr:DsbA family protein [Paracoccaceae bacterium]